MTDQKHQRRNGFTIHRTSLPTHETEVEERESVRERPRGQWESEGTAGNKQSIRLHLCSCERPLVPADNGENQVQTDKRENPALRNSLGRDNG